MFRFALFLPLKSFFYMRRMLWAVLLLPVLTYAQTKPITLEDIFKKNTFRSEQVRGFAAESSDALFNESDIKDESGQRLRFSDFTASTDKKHILFSTENEPIYRRSSKSTV